MSKTRAAKRPAPAETPRQPRTRAAAAKPKPEPKLLTRPEVAKALGVSERTARRMAGDAACPLGAGKRIKRTLYWTQESVQDARLWRVETGLDAPAPAKPKTARGGKKNGKAKAVEKQEKTATPSRAKANALAPKPKAAAAKPKAASPRLKTASAKTKSSASKTRAAAPRPGAATAKPVSASKAKRFREDPVSELNLDQETLSALLPLLGVDPNSVPIEKRGALLRRAGAALGRHLGPALDAARRETGLKPREPWTKLSSLASYEKFALERSAEMTADLLPDRRRGKVVSMHRA